MDRKAMRYKKSKPRISRSCDQENQSILGKVCSKVKDLLSPSWLFGASSWSESSEQQPGCSTDVEENSESRDNVVSQSVSHGSKRLRLQFGDHIPSIQSSSTQTWPEQPPAQNLFETMSRVPTSATEGPVLENKELVTMNGDDHSENSDGSASTSGCSSLVSHKTSNNGLIESPFRTLRTGIKRPRNDDEMMSKSGFPGDSSKCLMSDHCNSSLKFPRRIPTISRTNQPSFNISSFVGPSKFNQSAEKKVTSPFYEGKTTFGGASSMRRMPPNVAPYQVDKSLRSQIKTRDTQSNDSLEGMSSAARRILLTLEKMSTPVADAKKMPSAKTSPVDLSLYLNPPKSRRNTPYTPSLSNKVPPIANINTIAKLATLKNYGVNRLRNSNMNSPVKGAEPESTLCNLQTISSLQSNNDRSSLNSAGGGKMKNKSSLHYSSKDLSGMEMPELPSLPSIPLPVTNLPKIQFSFQPPTAKTVEENFFDKEFSFSSPIEHEVVVPEHTSSLKTVPLDSNCDDRNQPFVFSNPIEHELPTVQLYSKESQQVPLTGLFNSDKTWECSSCRMRYPSSQTSCQACQVPPNFTNFNEPGSKAEENQSEKSATISTPTPVSGKCNGEALMPNKSLSVPTPKETTSKTDSTPATLSSFQFQAGTATKSTWECSSCWIRNPIKEIKCLACEAPQPDKTTTQSTAQPASEKPKETVLTKKASDTWECSTCWIRNPSTESKCMACESLHPNKDKTSGLNDSMNFKFSSPIQNAPITFKFGSVVSTGATTNTTPSFKFGTVSTATSTSTPFKFGVTSNSEPAASSVSGFKFGIPTSTSASSNNASESIKSIFGSKEDKPSSALPSVKFGVSEREKKPADVLQSNDTSNVSKEQVSQPGDAKTTTKDNVSESTQKVIPTVTISDDKVESKEVNPSVTSAFSFTTQPILDSKKSETFSFGAPQKSSNFKSSVFPTATAGTLFNTKPSEKNTSATLVSQNETIPKDTNTAPAQIAPKSDASVPAKFSFSASSESNFVSPKPLNTESSKQPENAVPPNLVSPLSVPGPFGSKPNEIAPSTTSQLNAFATATTSSFTPVFSFGSKQSPAASKPAVTQQSQEISSSSAFAKAAPNFTFGSKTAELSASGNLQEKTTVNTSSVTSISSSPFTFGSKLNGVASGLSTEKTQKEKPAASGFSFGNSIPAATTTSSFSFFTSTNTVTTTTPAVAPVFKFGSSTTTPASSTGGFVFKASNEKPPTASQSQPTSTFPNMSSSTAPTGGFIFGAPKSESQNTTTATPASNPTPFVFGAATTASNTMFAGFQPQQTSAFQFGNQQANTSAPTVNSSSNTFTFGAKPQTTDPSIATGSQNLPSFGSAAGFGFLNKNEPVNTANNVAPASGFGATAPAFTFGANSDIPNQAPSSGVAFGSSSVPSPFGNSTTVPTFGGATTGGFNFGVSQTNPPAVFQFAASNVEKRPASFNFGTPAMPEGTNTGFSTGFNISTPPSFNFGATSTPAGPFQFAASTDAGASQASAPRKFRKAVRRVNK